jgi:hypothetical protein
MICIVTAFLDIKRGEWTNFQRSTEEYIKCFLPYLNMKEELIVFIDDKYYLEVLKEVVKSEKKNIIVFPINVEWLEKNLKLWSYLPIERQIMNTDVYKKLIDGKTNPEYNVPEYNTIMHCKLDFLKYVIENNLSKCEYYCWSDFGFFKSEDKVIPDNSILDINRFTKDKINICLVNTIDNFDGNLLNTLVNPRETIAGSFFLADKDNLLKYRQIYEDILLNDFYRIGIVDDDQHIALRCVLRCPDMFSLHLNGWLNVYNIYYIKNE